MLAGRAPPTPPRCCSPSGDDRHPAGSPTPSGLVGRNFMVHNNAHIAAVDLRPRATTSCSRRRWRSTTSTTTAATATPRCHAADRQGPGVDDEVPRQRAPLRMLDRVADRSVEWLVMGEDLPGPHNRVTVDADGRIQDRPWRRTDYDRTGPCSRAPRRRSARPGYDARARPALRHRHEQPPVRHPPSRVRIPRPASSTRGAEAHDVPTSGSSTPLLPVLRCDEPRADDRGAGTAGGRRVRPGELRFVEWSRPSLGRADRGTRTECRHRREAGCSRRGVVPNPTERSGPGEQACHLSAPFFSYL